jgi:hypothetical protein
MFHAVAVAALACGFPLVGAADEIPSFLSKGQSYASDPKVCKGMDAEGAPEDGLIVKADGLSGYEFGCTFVQFLPVKFADVDEINSYVAIASCGDDSGITRPDAISLSYYDDQLVVTSQNDYNLAGAKPNDGKGDPYLEGIVEKHFDLCK